VGHGGRDDAALSGVDGGVDGARGAADIGAPSHRTAPMDHRARRELRFLEAYALLLTAVVGVLAATAFRAGPQPARQRFAEIDVERINVVEPDGKLRLVIANRARSIGPVYKGKPFGYPGGTRPGIIFFNDEETENGGLTFSGRCDASGRYRASAGMSFDQFDQDQVVTLQYSDDNGTRRMGLTVADRDERNIHELILARDSITAAFPDTARRNAALRRLMGPRGGVPLYAERVYVGRDRSRSAVVNLSDPQGRPRLRLVVDSLGEPALEFLNDSGRVTARLPERR
jgi:hypothetical protein